MTPIPAFPLIHLPPGGRNPNFTGREPMLARLGAQLGRAQGTVVVSQAITGLGGVGKTQLAVEYIYRQQVNAQTAYDLVWWLRADTVVNLAADMAALAVAVGAMSADNPDQQAALNAARRWLAQTDKRWLLLVDNADDLPPRALNPYLPTGGKGHILITSRNPNWGGLVGQDAILPLDTFTRAEAIRFLQVRSRRFIAFNGDEGNKLPTTNGEEEGRLAELLGDFPLALEQAAAFMEARQMGCAAYRQVYETKRQEVWRRDPPPDRYHGTITTTWQMAFEQIQKTPGAVELLNLCCFLAPEEIPLDLIRGGVETLPATSLSADALALDDAVAALRRYSLVAREGGSLRLHRLVQTVARDRMPPELARQWTEVAVKLMLEAWPFRRNDMMTWEASSQLLPHLLAVIDLAAEQNVETEATAILNAHADFYLDHFGNLAAARPYSERALAIHEKALGPDHPHTATSLNNLAHLLQAMGDLAAARPYYERALSIREKALGPDHPDTAQSLNNLGSLLQAMGDLAAARPYYERALAIREKALGPDHPDTALSLNNLGALLRAMGDLAGARPYYERALSIREKALGPDHPDTAQSLNNLAILAYYEGDYPEAARLMRRALAIWEQRLGPQHPQTISARESLVIIEAKL